MKYELMALVNQIARMEQSDGDGLVRIRMEKLYDLLGEGYVQPTPEEVGKEIFNEYFNYIQENFTPIKEKEGKITFDGTYVKPFFVSPDDLLTDAEMDEDDFLDELISLLGIKLFSNILSTTSKKTAIRNQINKLKKELHRYKREQESIFFE